MQDQARIEGLGTDGFGPEAAQRAAIGIGHHIAASARARAAIASTAATSFLH